MRRTVLVLAALAGLALLSACTRPPPGAYAHDTDSPQSASGRQLALGKNTSGETCTASRTTSGGALIYCGSWHQPSAEVHAGPEANRANLNAIVTRGNWRAGLEQRYACGNPKPTTVLGHYPGEVLLCTQRIGGWPHVALAALIRGHVWFADGVQPAFPAMERAVGVISGAVPAADAGAMTTSVSDSQLADRLAAAAFTSGDIHEYGKLMTLGNRSNQAEDYPAAITAYRAALALQQKALGPENPNTVTPMLDLALNLSDQGDYSQADALLAQAAKLAPLAVDPTAVARLDHYRGLDQLNQGHDRRALRLLSAANRDYASLLPRSVLRPRPAATGSDDGFGLSAGSRGGSLLAAQSTLLSPIGQQALLGVIETLRYEGVVLDAAGHHKQAAVKIDRASAIASANGIAPPVLRARLDRSTAAVDTAFDRTASAAARLAQASYDFEHALPGSRPVADTHLLRGGVLDLAGQPGKALEACRAGIKLLARLRLGTSAALVAPCLDAANREAEKNPARAGVLRAEMFAMAELAQGSTTSREIAESAARLAADSKSPKVAAAIRAHQDAVIALSRLYRERDGIAHERQATPAAINAIDMKIAAATRRLAEADESVEAAAPNFGQLVQQVVPAGTVLDRLRPGEAFLDIMPAPDGTWTFLLHDGRIAVAHTKVDETRMTALVRKVRQSVVPTQAGLPTFAMTSAEAIYRATLAPFATDLAKTTAMVVSPAGALLSLPFALLPTEPVAPGTPLAKVPWLIRKMTLVYVPAAANFVSLRAIAGTSPAKQPWFGFGDFKNTSLAQAEATFSGPSCGDSARLFAGLPHLPYAKLELDAARAIFKAPASDELLGTAFTVPNVEHADLKQYRILHFATHALLPSELPCAHEPAIVTSPPPGARSAANSMLTTSDITNLKLNADLVILSACNTGGGDGKAGGEALSGLARAFFFAGARALMVTQWSVNDQVSSYLVATTLTHLASSTGEGAAASLRSAQLDLIRGAASGTLPAKLADPFFWAPFVVIGDGGQGTRNLAK